MTGEAAPDLKRVIGAMIFAANRPLSVEEMRRCLKSTAENGDSACKALGGARPADVEAAVKALSGELESLGAGFAIREVAGGYKLQSDGACGTWLRHLLEAGRPHRLSMPALETLAIVAYRQPITRSKIENIRGVSVDHVMRTLMEMQLVRITGRSDLPGRPFEYGTTQVFLEDFGLRSLEDLHGADPVLVARMLDAKERAGASAAPGDDADDGAREEEDDDDEFEDVEDED